MVDKHQRNLTVPIALFLCATFICATARAQPGLPSPAPTAAKPEAPKDVLGRSTPRGTVLGFLNVARNGDDQAAAQYLNTRLKGRAAESLADQLYVVLNRYLPARIDQISNRPEGSLADVSNPNANVIGTIAGPNGDVNIVVERMQSGHTTGLWLFSNRTLDAVPALYDEANTVGVEEILPAFLVNTKIAGVALFEWLAVLFGMPLIYAFAVLANRFISALVTYLVRRLGKRDSPPFELLPAPLRLLVVSLLIRWALTKIALPFLARQFWSSTAIAIAIVAIVWLFVRLNGRIESYLRQRLSGTHFTVGFLRFARRTVDILVVVAGILASLHYWGVSLAGALAGLGVGGIAVALAAQKTLENVIGGVTLIFDRALNVGDALKWGEVVGTVEDVGMRSTRLRTLDRTVLSIPNGQVSAVTLENLSVRDKFWLHPMVSLRYDTTTSQMDSVLQGIRGLLAKEPRIEQTSARVRFLRFGVSSLDIEIFAYFLSRNYEEFLEVQEKLLFQIMETIQSAGTSLALPSQTMYLRDGAVPAAINQERTSAAKAAGTAAGRAGLPPSPPAQSG
jgi:MscS family membrane protein